jgi:RNA polymerase sigma-70 factor (ECF subfamily)
MYANESDEILVNKFRSGDNKCFDAILLKYQQRVFSYILKMVKDQDLTNDIFQEVFIKVITSLKKDHYNHEGKLLSWILRIAHNQVIDHFRKDSKMPIAGRSPSLKDDFNIFDLLDLKEDSVEDIMVSKQIMEDVRLLVDELPEEQMEVVRMRYFLQMSFKDIADNTGVSINTSLGRMRYALINLRKLIEDKKLILTNS